MITTNAKIKSMRVAGVQHPKTVQEDGDIVDAVCISFVDEHGNETAFTIKGDVLKSFAEKFSQAMAIQGFRLVDGGAS